MNTSTLNALVKLYTTLGLENVIDDISNDYLTENRCRNGRDVLWYLDGTVNEAIYVDNLTFLSAEEIDEQLC